MTMKFILMGGEAEHINEKTNQSSAFVVRIWSGVNAFV